jgi:hypothetical protein
MDGKIIFKQIVEKQHVMTLTGLIWFWRGPAKTFLNTALNLFRMQKVWYSRGKSTFVKGQAGWEPDPF